MPALYIQDLIVSPIPIEVICLAVKMNGQKKYEFMSVRI